MSTREKDPQHPSDGGELSEAELGQVAGGLRTASGIVMTLEDGDSSATKSAVPAASTTSGILRTQSGISIGFDDPDA